jgi:hypothetical protein
MKNKVGHYRWIAWTNNDGSVEYGKSPYFGIREHTLTWMRKPTVVTQILVDFLGSLAWINLNENDLVK